MGLSSTTSLYIAELVLYLLLFPIVPYLAYRHGEHGLLGYFYLNVSCGVRVAADIVQIVERNRSGGPSIAAVVIGSIGLSPLLLALAGFLHEIHRYVLRAQHPRQEKIGVRWLWIAQINAHGVCATGMILLIIGAVHFVTAKTAQQVQSDNDLREAGAIILLVLWLGLSQYACWLLYRCHKLRDVIGRNTENLARGTVIAVLFLGVKVIYAVVYTFDHKNPSINPVTGSFAVKLLLVVGASLATVVSLIIAGWMSKDIARANIPSSTVSFTQDVRRGQPSMEKQGLAYRGEA